MRSSRLRVVAVNTFGARDPSLDGFGLADDVRWVDIFDLNDDGRLDIVALSSEASEANEEGSAVYIQGGEASFNGRGTAQAGLPLEGVHNASVGDFDSDGRLDLVLTTENSTYALVGDGSGGFSPSAAIIAGQGRPQPSSET